MKTFFRSSWISIIALAAVAESAYSQQPPDSVASDGSSDTAMGTGALANLNLALPNSNGSNTAAGAQALGSNTSGYFNTAVGDGSLTATTTGKFNTSVGSHSMVGNVTGSNNSALGVNALFFNGYLNDGTLTNDNSAFGYYALYDNTLGFSNSAFGSNALHGAPVTVGNDFGATGTDNTGIGAYALFSYSTGSNNIAVGYQAGYNVTIGNNNINIGNMGGTSENNTIRIGTRGGHRAIFIAGIVNSQITGSPVYVTNTGRLGVVASSERYKTAIAPIEDTAKLQRLRPVSFRLKADPKGAVQYGLIAEEVAKVYPELVVRNDKGRIEGVRYDELAPMLLKEAQDQAEEIRVLKEQMQQLQTSKGR